MSAASSSTSRAISSSGLYRWGLSEASSSFFSRSSAKMTPPSKLSTGTGAASSQEQGVADTSGTAAASEPKFVSTSIAKDQVAAVCTEGKLWTQGKNKYSSGRITTGGGDVSGVDLRLSAVNLPHACRQVALGAKHGSAVLKTGELYAWGWGGSFFGGAGALGFKPDRDHVEEPALVETLAGEKVKQVACGEKHTAVLTESGRVFTTGSGEYGLLGLGDVSDSAEFELVEHYPDSEFEAAGVAEDSIVKIDCGLHHTAALTKQGELFVWGRNDQAQLGLGDESMGDNFSFESFPRLVRALPLAGLKVADFACGDGHTDVLTECGKVFTWGNRNWLSPHRISRTLEEHSERQKAESSGAGSTQTAASDSGGTTATEIKSRKIFVEDDTDPQNRIKKLIGGGRFSLLLTQGGSLFGWGKKNTGCLPEDFVEPTLFDPFTTTGEGSEGDKAAKSCGTLLESCKIADLTARGSHCVAIVE
ncbi:unnamed protein product [Amoebophrya sp. A120]|nr:unnamed protein product [Amoebophrya sp. A120]|eukprot:GSA120T00012606001.1